MRNSNDFDTAQFKWHMALALNRRFEYSGEVMHLDRAISLGLEVLESVAQDDPRRIDLLLDISDFEYSKYMKSGSKEHFDSATALAQQAMETDLPHDRDRPLRLCTLSRRFKERYTFSNDENDIERSIELAQKAIELLSPGHPHTPYCLWSLSLAFETRYRAVGSLSDLERAISINQDALATVSLGRLDRVDILHSLSVQLTHRYEQLGALVDLEEAIHLMQECKTNMPESNKIGRVVCLKVFCDQLGYLFERNSDMSTLKEAITTANKALELYTDEDPAQVSILNSLGLLFKLRFGVTDSLEDLEAAIEVQRKALRLIPDDNPERSIALYNVSASLADLYRHKGEPWNLTEALQIAWEVLDAAAESHPNRAMYLDLVGMLMQEFPDDAGSIIAGGHRHVSLLIEALHHENSPPLDRIKAGQHAFHSCVRDGAWSAANSVARDVVALSPLLVPCWMSRAGQQHLLKNLSCFTSLAASAVLHVDGSPASALQILEAGRGVIAGLTVDLKADIPALKESEPALYQEYAHLRRRILLPIASSLTKVAETIQPVSTRRLRQNPSRINSAGLERADCLRNLEQLEDRIRAVPGFEHFLERWSEQDYISLASSGPIVAFNVTEHRSDAILITSTGVTNIRLERLHFLDVKTYVPKVIGKNQLSKGRASTRKQRNQELRNILQWLWNTAVLPVLTELNLYIDRGHSETDIALPRIWWMTSGYMGLFPMHAAGDGNGTVAMDYVVSSYVATLRVLRFSQSRHSERLQDADLKMLVVPAPEKEHQKDLDSEAEIQAIKDSLKDNVSYKILHEPSRADVVSQLPNSHLLHFSCHGESNAVDPSKSALILAQSSGDEADDAERNNASPGSNLTVQDLARINHDKAQLAYLSACSTAENSSEDLLDEVIHIASAFQLIGFPHVVGTLWEIRDIAAVAVSRLFYGELGRRVAAGENLSTNIAHALHEALKQYRGTKRVSRSNDVLSWVPFIHMGA